VAIKQPHVERKARTQGAKPGKLQQLNIICAIVVKNFFVARRSGKALSMHVVAFTISMILGLLAEKAKDMKLS